MLFRSVGVSFCENQNIFGEPATIGMKKAINNSFLLNTFKESSTRKNQCSSRTLSPALTSIDRRSNEV